jgi:hypothetical protein
MQKNINHSLCTWAEIEICNKMYASVFPPTLDNAVGTHGAGAGAGSGADLGVQATCFR